MSLISVQAAQGRMADALSALRPDTACISRSQQVRQPNRTTQSEYTVVIENLPCRLAARPAQTREDAALARAELSWMLYTAPGTNIRAGDRVTVADRHGEGDRTFYAGLPVFYDSHTETPLRTGAVA